MSQKAKRTIRSGALALAALLCLGGIYGLAGADLVIEGRDIVEADSGGGDLLAAGKGEGLHYGTMATRYPFITTAKTLQAASTSATDAGYLVIEGINSSGDAAIDSVLIAGRTQQTFSGTWLAVNRAEFHDDSTNVGEIRVYYGGNMATGSLLAQIAARQRKTNMAQYTLPTGRTQLQVYSWEISPTTVFSGAPSSKVGGNGMGHMVDSVSVGRVALLARKPGQAWQELRGFNFRSDLGPASIQMVQPETYDLPGLTQLEVAAAVTGASTDLNFRARIGVK